MRISILTLFPQMFSGPFDFSIVKRAQEKGHATINYINIRDFATDAYKTVDDHPYGGGQGMVLRVDVIDRALNHVKSQISNHNDQTKTILLDPRGKTYKQADAKRLSAIDHLIIICGHYEGMDERIRSLVDETISVGDYVLTGGEIPAMAIVDSVIRLLPGVLKDPNAIADESFSEGLLEYPQYTRPPSYNAMDVPEMLLSGNHAEIEKWRKQQSKELTKKHRPDLIQKD